jgi:hypothetical protein
MINGISLQEDQQELVAKANAAVEEAPNDGATYGRRGSDETWVAVPTTPGGSTVAWVDITGKPATFPPTVPIAQADVTGLAASLAAKEPTIAGGTALQYWRGDKVFATLDKAAVGLGNVDNTSDAAKPVSTAQATAIAAKVNKLGDQMTGNLNIAKTDPALVLTKTAVGQTAAVFGYLNTTARCRPSSMGLRPGVSTRPAIIASKRTSPSSARPGTRSRRCVPSATPRPILASSRPTRSSAGASSRTSCRRR